MHLQMNSQAAISDSVLNVRGPAAAVNRYNHIAYVVLVGQRQRRNRPAERPCEYGKQLLRVRLLRCRVGRCPRGRLPCPGLWLLGCIGKVVPPELRAVQNYEYLTYLVLLYRFNGTGTVQRYNYTRTVLVPVHGAGWYCISV